MYKHILIATDGSEIADRAVSNGISLAKSLGAKVTVFMAIRPWHTIAPAEVMVSFPKDEYLSEAETYAKKTLDKVKKAAESSDVACNSSFVVHEYPWQAITEASEREQCDLIVMGSHGYSGLTKLLLGSEAQSVMSHAKVPVLICR